MTWRDESDVPTLEPAEARAKWDAVCKKLAEPIRSTFQSIPKNARLWVDRLTQWPTLPWDNHSGRVTLAGDAAHPMTYREFSMLSYDYDGNFYDYFPLDPCFTNRYLGMGHS